MIESSHLIYKGASVNSLSVSEINAQIKSFLESTFMDICVHGEISSVKIHTSGHIYLSLKDESSSVRCVMFKGNTRSLKINLEVGQSVLINGSLSVYAPKGEYQIICKNITLAGIGELSLRYEALKAKLQAKGYFEISRKKPIPRFPKRIALLTSATGAAKEDMLKVAKKRWECVHITLFNTLVQGYDAKDSIVANIKLADSFFGTTRGFDVLVIGRGGGSIEDMWAFNEECVAQAIFEAKTPIVSAVGHEVDVFISDFVSDMRAPTPSAAMEMLLPDKDEWLRNIDESMNAFSSVMKRHMAYKNEMLMQMKEYFRFYNFKSQYEMNIEHIKTLGDMIKKNFINILQEKILVFENIKIPLQYAYEEKLKICEKEYECAIEALNALNPALLCERGYVQMSKHNKPIRFENLCVGDRFYLSDISSTICVQYINDELEDSKI